MKALELHRWDATPAEARRIQEELRARLVLEDRWPGGRGEKRKEKNEKRLSGVRHVAGADVAFAFEGGGTSRGQAVAGVIVYAFPEMREVERTMAVRPLEFPYVPGLLSFRELPALLAAFEKLRTEPDVIFCDAQGYAHPRRFGLACHLGVLLDRPTIGCAKSRLTGTHRAPAQKAASWVPLRDDTEIIGAAVRTRAGVKPIYVSQGHRISLRSAMELTLAVCDGYRIPRPTREADHYVRMLKRCGWGE